MTTYLSPDIQYNKPIAGYGAGGGITRWAYTKVTTVAVLTTSDVINLFYLPPHSRVQSLIVKVTDLDSGTTATLNIGDTGGIDSTGAAIAADADRYLAASTIGQTGGVVDAMAATGVFFYTGEQKVLVTASLAAGPTTTAGTLEVAIGYVTEDPYP